MTKPRATLTQVSDRFNANHLNRILTTYEARLEGEDMFLRLVRNAFPGHVPYYRVLLVRQGIQESVDENSVLLCIHDDKPVLEVLKVGLEKLAHLRDTLGRLGALSVIVDQQAHPDQAP